MYKSTRVFLLFTVFAIATLVAPHSLYAQTSGAGVDMEIDAAGTGDYKSTDTNQLSPNSKPMEDQSFKNLEMAINTEYSADLVRIEARGTELTIACRSEEPVEVWIYVVAAGCRKTSVCYMDKFGNWVCKP